METIPLWHEKALQYLGAYYVGPYNGQVRVSDSQCVYIVHRDEAEAALALETPPEPERERFNTGRRQVELYNAELAARQGRDWESDVWGSGMIDAPSPWR